MADEPKEERTLPELTADVLLAKARGLAGIVLAALALFFSVFLALDARSQTKVDGGIAPVVGELREFKNEVKSELKELRHTVDGLKNDAARNAGMLEQLVKDRRLEVPPRVDGGL